MQTLPEWLIWIIWNGGAGTVAFGALALLEQWAAFKSAWDQLSSEIKRYLSFVLAGALGALALWAQVQLGYRELPAGLTEWAEILFSVAFAQVLHARVFLSKRS